LPEKDAHTERVFLYSDRNNTETNYNEIEMLEDIAAHRKALDADREELHHEPT
jgi:hypothetical protein